MPTNWLTTEELAAWRTYIEVSRDLMAALESDLEPHGLTHGDYEVLVHLSEAADDRMRMCDLAAVLRLSPSGLTRRLDALVRRGWVERRPSTEDRRVLFAQLTAAGRGALEDAAPTHVAGVRQRVLEPLGRPGLIELGKLMSRLHGATHREDLPQ